MAGGRHFENRKNRHIAATVWPIVTKSGTVTRIVRTSWNLEFL